MILGIGTDLVEIARIEKVIKRHGARFIARCFAPGERTFGADAPQAAAHYAKRFAAKEAAAKALGTGVRAPVTLRDFAVTNDPLGQPRLTLSGGAGALLKDRARAAPTVCHLSLSDEGAYAQAFVVIEILSELTLPG